MYEEPPPLPFPSLQNLKSVAVDILKTQKTLATPDVEFKIFDPDFSLAIAEKKKRTRQNCKACEVCKKKKVRCDINTNADERCTRSNCQCLHHQENAAPDADGAAVKELKAVQRAEQPGINSNMLDFHSSSNNNNNNNNNNDNNNNNNSVSFNQHETAPSSTVFRKPALLKSGHFTGETSFCEHLTTSYHRPSTITVETNFPTLTAIPEKPKLDKADQLHLIDVYYENLNPFYPLINKQELIEQLEYVFTNKESYLSPLFYYALFARAAQLPNTSQRRTVDKKSFEDLGEECLAYSSFLTHLYKDKSRISTILALIIMANHVGQKNRLKDLTQVWLWVGEAFRMALDLGIHRSFVTDQNDPFGQLSIRTFWLTYVTDCTLSMVYGRPSATEEKVLDVGYPKKLDCDDDHVSVWMDGLDKLIALSKVTSRVIRFNYCPPPPFVIQGPIKRHNAFLVSVDSWLIDIMHPAKKPESPFPSVPNTISDETLLSRRLQTQNRLLLYTNLILLHRPYVSDIHSARNMSNRPSYDICSYAAIIITDLTSKLDITEVLYHSALPVLAYALVMAIRVHIMNAASSNSDKFNAKKNFEQSLATLSKLPQAQDAISTLNDAMQALEYRYNHRFADPTDIDETESPSHTGPKAKQQQIITAAQIVFSPNAIEKPITNGNSTLSFSPLPENSSNQKVDAANLGNARASLVIKDYTSKIDSIGRKKKKTKLKHSKQTPSSTTNNKQHHPQRTNRNGNALSLGEHPSAALSPRKARQQTTATSTTSFSVEQSVQQLAANEYFPILMSKTSNMTHKPYSDTHQPTPHAYGPDNNANITNPSIAFPHLYNNVQTNFTLPTSMSSLYNQMVLQPNSSLFPANGEPKATFYSNTATNNYPAEQGSLNSQHIPFGNFNFLNNDLLFDDYTLPMHSTNSTNTTTETAIPGNNTAPFLTLDVSNLHDFSSNNNLEAVLNTNMTCQNIFNDYNPIQ